MTKANRKKSVATVFKISQLKIFLTALILLPFALTCCKLRRGVKQPDVTANVQDATPAQQADVSVTINTDKVLRTLERNIFGINLNYLLDGGWAGEDADLSQLVNTLRAAILRYPGGEKSDATYFAQPPDFLVVAPTLIRASEWPRGDATLFDTAKNQFIHRPVDFDQFIQVCRETSAQALIVLPYDILYARSHDGAQPPPLEELLSHARAWVAYTRQKNFPVLAWEIGNESYLASSYNGQATAADYAEHLLQFAAAIREVDPEAKIAACGPQDGFGTGNRDSASGADAKKWWETVLTRAGHVIDYMSIHSYPVYGWKKFESYNSRDHTLLKELASLEAALQKWATTADAARIKFLITETNSADWSGDGVTTGWNHASSFAHGLVLFHILADVITHPRVEAALVWNTRWRENKTSPQLWDAVDSTGALLPTGVALQTAARYLTGELLATEIDARPHRAAAWATRLQDGRIRLILINRQSAAQTVALRGLQSNALQVFSWSPCSEGPQEAGLLNREVSAVNLPISMLPYQLLVLEFPG